MATTTKSSVWCAAMHVRMNRFWSSPKKATANAQTSSKKTNITEKTGKLVAIMSVSDDNDLMIINKSGITIRLKVADLRLMGRATQGVRLINLEKRNDQIAAVCRVSSENEADELLENVNEEPVIDSTNITTEE